VPIVQYNVKLSESERKLLAKRAAAEGVSEADHLRLCMLLDAVMACDLDAVRIAGGILRKKLGQRLHAWKGKGLFEGYDDIAPGRAKSSLPEPVRAAIASKG